MAVCSQLTASVLDYMLPASRAHVRSSHQHMSFLEQYLGGGRGEGGAGGFWNLCEPILLLFFWLQNLDFPLVNVLSPIVLSVKWS